MYSLVEIKQKIEQLAGQINAPVNQMLTYGTSENDGKPYIEIIDSYYYYLAFDRNIRTVNRRTQNVDDLLFWVFAGVTSNMATSYELAHRDPNTNYRKVLFSHQLGLLEKLNPNWRERREKEIDEILNANPYSD